MYVLYVYCVLYPINCLNHLNLYTMLTFTLGPAVAWSTASDWTTMKKAVAIIQLAALDCGVIMLICW